MTKYQEENKVKPIESIEYIWLSLISLTLGVVGAIIFMML